MTGCATKSKSRSDHLLVFVDNGFVNIEKNFSKDLEISSILESFKLNPKETKKLIKKQKNGFFILERKII